MFFFIEFRADADPCTDNYAGSSPFSEPESKAIRDLILKYEPVTYLTLHSYGPVGFCVSEQKTKFVISIR